MIEFLKNIDASVFRACNFCGTNAFFDFIAYCADMLISKGILFAVVFFLIFFTKKDKLVSIMLLAGMNVSYFVNASIKSVIARHRPYDVMVNVNIRTMLDSFAFPSGHTAIAFTFAIIAAHFYRKYSLIFYGVALIVGFSRVYDGMHFPSDVIGGMILGLLVGKALLVLTKEIWQNEY